MGQQLASERRSRSKLLRELVAIKQWQPTRGLRGILLHTVTMENQHCFIGKPCFKKKDVHMGDCPWLSKLPDGKLWMRLGLVLSWTFKHNVAHVIPKTPCRAASCPVLLMASCCQIQFSPQETALPVYSARLLWLARRRGWDVDLSWADVWGTVGH